MSKATKPSLNILLEHVNGGIQLEYSPGSFRITHYLGAKLWNEDPSDQRPPSHHACVMPSPTHEVLMMNAS